MAGKVAQPKMSMRVLLEGLGLAQYYRFFQQAGMSMIDGHTHWTDVDVEDILDVVERRTGYSFAPKERVKLWKALRLMWARGPGHDCPFIQAAEVPALFLPKRDWRQMDSDVKYAKLEPDRQRQVLRRKTVQKGGRGLVEKQFEVYIRQQDIFYELKDVQACVAAWMKSDPRKMLREDPREEAMKLRIRTMMDAAAGYLQVRKVVMAGKRSWGHFFLFVRIMLCSMSLLLFATGYLRYGNAPPEVKNSFFVASGQFRSGTAFMLAYWIAFLVNDRTKEDHQKRRFQRIIIALERLMEEISSFRVETDHIRMEEHEAVQRNESAALTYEQNRSKKVDTSAASKVKKRRKKKVDKELDAWAPGVKIDNMEDFKLKTAKAIEESFKRLPPLPDNFRRGNDRMLQFEDKGMLGGVEENTLHVKAPWQMVRGEARPTNIAIEPPSMRVAPPPRRPPLPPPGGMHSNQGPHPVPSLEDLRHSAMGGTPPYGQMTPLGTTGDMFDHMLDDGQSPKMSMREALTPMRSASGSLPPSPARTKSHLPEDSAEFFPPVAEEVLPEEPPLQPQPKKKRGGRRGSKDVTEEALTQEQMAYQQEYWESMMGTSPAEATATFPPDSEPAQSDLRDAGASGEPPPLPPPPCDDEDETY